LIKVLRALFTTEKAEYKLMNRFQHIVDGLELRICNLGLDVLRQSRAARTVLAEFIRLYGGRMHQRPQATRVPPEIRLRPATRDPSRVGREGMAEIGLEKPD
jgi:hypothetical protein